VRTIDWLRRIGQPAVIVTAVLALLPAALPAGAATGQRFDGNWAIYIFGAPGHCQFGYKVKMTIDDGNVLFRGRQVSPHAINVTNAGAVTLRLGTGRFTVIGSGAINTTRGSGRWTAAGFRCTGWWRAERQ
jgi:hypothetical protein